MIFIDIYKKLDRMTSKKIILSLFFLSHSVLLVMVFFTLPKINEKFGTQAFDLKTFGYSLKEAKVMLENLDQFTIDLYLFPQLFLLDILYPLLLALFLSALIIRLSKLIDIGQGNIFSNLYILPFIGMIMDYFENVMISIMITNIEDISSGIIRMASIFTLIKGMITIICWLVIVSLFTLWIIKKFSNK